MRKGYLDVLRLLKAIILQKPKPRDLAARLATLRNPPSVISLCKRRCQTRVELLVTDGQDKNFDDGTFARSAGDKTSPAEMDW